MKQTTFQHPELRDANDNIIQQGAFGKNTALANATNDGWIDYVANNLEFLYDIAKDEVVPVPSLPASGQMNKTYLLTTTGVSYRWSGTEWVAVSSSEAVGRAETAAQAAATSASNAATSATAAANSAKAAADSTKNYLPLSGGTMTGWLSANADEFRIRNSKAEHDGMVSVFGGAGTATGANLCLYGTSHSSQAGRFVLSATDGANTKSLRGQADGTLTWNNKEIATTAFVNAKAENYLPLSGGTVTGDLSVTGPITGNVTGNVNGLKFSVTGEGLIHVELEEAEENNEE